MQKIAWLNHGKNRVFFVKYGSYFLVALIAAGIGKMCSNEMEYLKIAGCCVAWVALYLGACAAMVGVIALCGKEDNGDYAEPNEGK